MMNKLSDAVEFLNDGMNAHAAKRELEELQAVYEYSRDATGLKAGQRVLVRDGYILTRSNPDGSYNGWWPYRECLTAGAKATVEKLHFISKWTRSPGWRADIKLDEEWTLAPDRDQRFWHGTAATCPPGFTPPDKQEAERRPEGRRSLFMMRAENLVPFADFVQCDHCKCQEG